MAVLIRSDTQIERALAAVDGEGLPWKTLDGYVQTEAEFVSITTMHLAKGLEFRSVAVMACADEIIPLQERNKAVGDEADFQEIYDSERHLLYVACTCA